MNIDLNSVANIAEIIGAFSIITGLIFGYFQLTQYRAQQRNAIAGDLARTFYKPELADAIALIQSLPDDISLAELRAKGDAYVRASITVTTSFETMGLLVHKNIAPFDLVMDLVGGIVIAMNRKMNKIQRDLRKEQNQPSWAEWFEWLANQIVKYKETKAPAHILYKDWSPKKHNP